MISVALTDTVRQAGQYLRDSGYNYKTLGYELDLSDGLHANHENLEPLLARTDGDSSIAVLARLFFVSWPVGESRCRKVLPAEFLNHALACGLLDRDGSNLVSTASLIPFRNSIIASDSCRTRSSQADMVTGPSASTQYPARMAVGGESETTLDLGTGSGALAFEAARYSRKVMGTDINERALQYAQFNALLNGVGNVEWRCGDAFAPVAGQKFTRIVANPPFFLSPEKSFTFCDSPAVLDGFTEQLARTCHQHLEEGGFYQMICEFVDLESTPWEQRLRNWTAASGCDVLVVLAPPTSPITYAEKRAQEAKLMVTSGLDGYFTRQYRYLKDYGVKQVMTGLVNMRKRSGGANWFANIVTDPVGQDIGADLRARFDSLTFVATSSDDRILACHLRLTDDVFLEQTWTWRATNVQLVKPRGLVDRLRLDEAVARFLPLFDGSRSVKEIAVDVSAQSHIALEEAEHRCVQLAKRLLQANFVSAKPPEI